jgi:hypothetical protein
MEIGAVVKWRFVLSLLILINLAQVLAAQQQTVPDTCRKGAVIRHPEKVAGPWLADVHHRIFGMQIVLTTRARKSPKASEGVIQTCEQASIEVFEQLGSERANGDGNWFDTNLPGVAWTGNHLKIDYAGVNGGDAGPEINLDLRFDPESETWSGRFHRDTLDEAVTLRRPRPVMFPAKSRFVGTWKRAGLANDCMHIAEGRGGDLSAWSDDILILNSIQNGKGVPAPRDTIETYGFTAQVEVQSAHNIFVRLKALTPVCCTVDVGGVLSKDGTKIRSNTQSDDRRNPGSEDWVRVRGDSCLVEER